MNALVLQFNPLNSKKRNNQLFYIFPTTVAASLPGEPRKEKDRDVKGIELPTIQHTEEVLTLQPGPAPYNKLQYPDLYPDLTIENEVAIVPAGFVVCFNQKGATFLSKVPEGISHDEAQKRANKGEQFLPIVSNFATEIASSSSEAIGTSISEAMTITEKTPILASNNQISKKYGSSFVLYFDFMIFIVLTNCIITLLSMAHWVPHLIIDYKKDAGFEATFGNVSREVTASTVRKQMYLASYTQDSFYPWFISSIVLVLFTFFVGFWYVSRVKNFFRKNEETDNEGHFKILDEIPENQAYSAISRILRIGFGYLIFIAMLFISGGLTFGITVLQVNLGNSKLGSVACAFVVVVIGILWPRIAIKINQMEKHPTWGAFRRHLLFKYLTFKELNIFAMYLSKYIVLNTDSLVFGWDVKEFWFDSTPTKKEKIFQLYEKKCGLVDMGDQILILMLVDLFISNFVEIFFTPLYNFATKTLFCKPIPPEDKLGDFELAEEYLELIYRQFILYFSTAYFPVVSLLCLVVNICEIFVDRYRLFRKTKQPPVINGSMKSIILAYLLLSALFAFLLFPRGVLFTLLGFTNKNNCPNSVYQNSFYGGGNTTFSIPEFEGF
eukprot:TRINITY_DN3467_c0_g1_i2.p1 TRINITY_DN3467_c0_g1~~TRINITY_DN3467_c0_g1_i2.p1  ORF type:complete len:610 (-),score=121.38 TRINITY_DN3467_c0_g1_i2:44-1873(-)